MQPTPDRYPVFFVQAASPDGDNLDLHVRIATPEAAIAAWRRTYELDAAALPHAVFVLEPTTLSALAWHRDTGARQVWPPPPLDLTDSGADFLSLQIHDLVQPKQRKGI